ncbi:MAG: L-lysine 2,3-aminomutase [Chlamydiia bacterium]|nr:L-lysine 2,3-aminomutase [Chlamydiia bacterium]MCH9616495.1 L-lysine 2,3-aminomutase [Chlamydiia bacterium]MCH9629519.1 L-lysine 2,3-aminomutase [Chlamydiia bacterium]
MTWQDVLKTNYTSPEVLSKDIKLPVHCSPFVLNLPRRLADKIEKGNVHCPLYKQFVPQEHEALTSIDFKTDPVEDNSFAKTPKLLHKYEGRALLLTTSACAMHCRYCFRQNYDYNKEKGFEEELDLIRNDPTIFEVILSGGDPLSLPDKRLDALLTDIDAIEHIKFVRFHTRFPIGIPERITPDFLAILKRRVKPVFILHINHPRELDSDVQAALEKLPRPVYNQAVLLKGVNDNVETLKALSIRLTECGVNFYYLHQLDQVQGAMHFEVPIERGLSLIDTMRASMPGYMVPSFVAEIPNKTSKTPLWQYGSYSTQSP